MILRDYQNTMVAETRQMMRYSVKSILVQLATGGGKTALATFIIANALKKGKTIFFTVHRKDLLKQTAKTFEEFDIKYSFIAAGNPYNPYSKAFICSIDTLKNRLEISPIPDILVVDEAHFSGSDGWSRVINFYKSKGTWIIGLSATPVRLDGKGLGVHFDKMVCGPSMKELIAKRHLSDYKLFTPHVPDTSGISKRMGEFVQSELEQQMMADKARISDAVKHYKKHAMGKLAILYAVSRKDSLLTAQIFCEAGISAVHIDGETPMPERAKIINKFADRETLVLCNVALMDCGFDLASQVGRDVTVECIIDTAPTESLAKQLQKLGRGLRKKDFPAVIIDTAGNTVKADGTIKHGFPDMERFWSLQGIEKRKSGGERAIPIKQCSGGFKNPDMTGEELPACYYTHRPAPQCPNCGAYYPIKSRKVEEVEGELHEIDRNNFVPKVYDEKAEKKQIYALAAVGKKRGMSPDRAVKWAEAIVNKQKAKRSAK